MTVAIFNQIANTFKGTVAGAVNGHCNTNTSTWAGCCGVDPANATYMPNASNPLSYTTSGKIQFAENYPMQSAPDRITVILVLKADKTNALCAAGGAKRRRRAVSIGAGEIALPQSVLTNILSDPATQASVATDINNNLPAGTNITVAVLGVSAAQQPTTAAPTTTTMVQTTAAGGGGNAGTTGGVTVPGTTAAPGAGTPAWVIAVAVVGGLVGLVIIIVIIVLIIKRPSKVGSADLSGEDGSDHHNRDGRHSSHHQHRENHEMNNRDDDREHRA